VIQPSNLQDLERELSRRRREDPLLLQYKPIDKQIELHRSRKNLTIAVGGNRSGKSFASVAETQYYCLGRDVWAEVPTPPVMVWYVMPSLPMFRRAIKPIMKRLIPEKKVRRFYWRDGIIEYRNGSELHILSADMRQKRVQGASIDLAILDETPEQDIFDEAQARTMDRHGRIILAFAPLDVSVAWVRDGYYIPWVNGDKPGIDVVHFPTADRDGHSLVPWFTDADIKDAEERWPDPATRAARLYGEFITRSGRVYNFAPETHLIPRFEVPEHYSRWLIIDPQYHRFAALYYAADEEGTYYVTDEYFSQDESLAHRAERIAAIVGKKDRAIPAYVDSANPQDTAELNYHFQRIGASVAAIPLPFKKNIDATVLKVHSMLEPSDTRVYRHAQSEAPLYGAPRLVFFNDLCSTWSLPDGKDFVTSRLFWEMNHLSWGKVGKPDKDTADGADCCDCLGYGCTVLHVGTEAPLLEKWQDGLSLPDLLTWDLINRSDRWDRRGRED
jgi:phage terminase large subunit-like protein